MLGDKIREARKKASLTQAELAEKIGVKRSVVSKYETGAISPTYDMISNIAVALNISVYFLVGSMDDEGAIDIGLSAIEISKETGIDPTIIMDAYDELNIQEAFYDKNALDAVIKRAKEIERRQKGWNYSQIRRLLYMLNEDGQREAIKRVSELTELSKYRRK